MKYHHLLFSALAASALLIPADALAKKGAPHTFSAAPNFSNVKVSWLNPTEPKELKWHDDEDYDGDSGRQLTTQAPAVIYVASEFSAEDLALVKGEKIEGLSYFEYRPVLEVKAIIWENGKIVREQNIDLKTPEFKANQWRAVKFDEPYELTGDKTVRFGFKITHGSNIDFVAIMNRYVNSKGDLRSYDGKTWYHNGRGTYLITANLANDVDEAPSTYNVYVDGEITNPMPVITNSYTVKNLADGVHKIKVEANYTSGESFTTAEAEVNIKGADSFFPTIANATAVTDGVTGLLEWEAPLQRDGNELTWSNKQQATTNGAIGGTAASNTKVWIKNEFTADDLLQYKDAKITAINAHFNEATVSAVTLFVMQDGVFIHNENVAEDVVKGIQAKEWTKFTLSTPVEIEAGHSYTYGYYILHTPKTYPVSVDTTNPMGSKSNSFSTSSPNSTNFNNSKPSWRTLASGNIAGGWMLTADVEGGSAVNGKIASYNVYRNGEKVGEGIKTTSFEDEVPAPGTYTYGIESVGTDGKTSAQFPVKATYKLPDSYRAPLIGTSELDKDARTVAFNWSMDVEIKHYGSATYKVGFDEDMALTYGTRFTAAELADYEGYSINAVSFIIGEDIPGGFKVQIQNGAGSVLWEQEFPAGAVTPLMLYSFPLDTPVKITGSEDLYLAYSGTLKGGTSPIVLDAGPLVSGGAVVKLPGMPTWLNLGTINSTYNNYNIVIGAVVSEPEANAQTASKEHGLSYLGAMPMMSAQSLREGFGIDGGNKMKAVAPRALKPSQFNVYRNGELIASTSSKQYVDNLSEYDTYTYTVSAIYPNGWESAQSDPLVIENNIRQAAPAPYDLKIEGNTLSWKAPQTAPVLTYAVDGMSYGVGTTGSGTRETYAVHKYEPQALKEHDGKVISHIKFALYTTDLYTASVVVFKDFNIIYEQELNVDDLVAVADGYNNIRLNKAVAIDAESTYMIGYHITYANGIKPMLFDAGPATDGYGNLLSASATQTSWKSLKSMNSSLDGNWRIYATLASPAGKLTKAEGLTYNIYRDGKLFKNGITTESYTHSEELAEGDYTVTAGEGENETAHSNVFRVETSGIDEVAADQVAARYDAASQTVIAAQGAAAEIVNVAGQVVLKANGSVSVAHLPEGIYLYVPADGAKALRFVK